MPPTCLLRLRCGGYTDGLFQLQASLSRDLLGGFVCSFPPVNDVGTLAHRFLEGVLRQAEPLRGLVESQHLACVTAVIVTVNATLLPPSVS